MFNNYTQCNLLLSYINFIDSSKNIITGIKN